MNELPTMTWLIARPNETIQNVLLTRADNTGKRFTEMGCILGEDDKARQSNILAYMIIPHINEDRTPWKSEYMGDDMPKESGEYICCLESRDNFLPRLKVRKYWFDKKTGCFGGAEMMGYMAVPKPYDGKRVMVA